MRVGDIREKGRERIVERERGEREGGKEQGGKEEGGKRRGKRRGKRGGGKEEGVRLGFDSWRGGGGGEMDNTGNIWE